MSAEFEPVTEEERVAARVALRAYVELLSPRVVGPYIESDPIALVVRLGEVLLYLRGVPSADDGVPGPCPRCRGTGCA